MKINKKYSIIIILLVIIIGFVFYWYEWRPKRIIEECVKQKGYCSKGFTFQKCTSDEKEIIYKDCLRKHGLEK